MDDPAGLLKEWREAYAYSEHRQLNCFTLADRKSIFGKPAERSSKSLDGRVSACLASFSAADQWAPHVMQSRTWVFVRPSVTRELLQEIGAKEVDSGANLVVLEAADEGVFDGAGRGSDGVPMTSALQSHLDLWKVGGRGEEAANAIFEQCLNHVWEEGREKD